MPIHGEALVTQVQKFLKAVAKSNNDCKILMTSVLSLKKKFKTIQKITRSMRVLMSK